MLHLAARMAQQHHTGLDDSLLISVRTQECLNFSSALHEPGYNLTIFSTSMH